MWRGGSMMAVALTLMDRGVDDRDFYMFDTFTHMPFPGEHDVTFDGGGRRTSTTTPVLQRRTATSPSTR